MFFKVRITYKKGATYNDEMIIDYVRRVVVPHMRKYNLNKLYLLLDHAKCHEKATVSAYCDKKGVILIFVPKRLTNLLQPADVFWFALIKMIYGDKWNDWFIFEDKRLTIHGNMVSPGFAKIIQWLSEIWTGFNSDIIVESFRKCGNI